MATYKYVDVIIQKPIRTTSVPILSTTFNLRLKLEDILICILEKATVLEILSDGRKLRLDLDNYKLNNGIGGGEEQPVTPPTSNGKPETFPFVSNVLEKDVYSPYLVTGEAIKNYIDKYGNGEGSIDLKNIDGLGFTGSNGAVIRVKRGSKEDLPTLAAGEFGLALDERKLYIGGLNGNISIPSSTDLNGKVDKVEGKGLSSNDYTDEDKEAVSRMVEILEGTDGKGLSSNDYTDEDKEAVSRMVEILEGTDGKGLSSNDYTNEDKEIVSLLSEMLEAGKELSSNDYTNEDKEAVSTIQDKADKVTVTNMQTQITSLINQVNIIKNLLGIGGIQTLQITNFSANITSAELGSVINSINFAWAYNGEPTSQKFEGETIDVNLRNYTYTGAVSANKTFTLTATDSDGSVKTATISIKFSNGVYYGVSSSTNYNSALISSLTKVLSDTKERNITVDAKNEDEYIYYCIPSRLGVPTFNVGGFDGGFEKMATIPFTNSNGYTEDYDIYRSDNPGLGATTVRIS